MKTTLCILLSIFSSLSFVIGQDNYVGMSELPTSSTSYLFTALAILFAILYYFVHCQKKVEVSPWHIIFGVIFGILNTFMNHLFAYDQWNSLLSPIPLLIIIVKSLFQALPMISLLSYMDFLLQKGTFIKNTENNVLPIISKKLNSIFNKYPKLFCFVLFIVCWSPYLIIYYPGTVSWDLSEMFAQFQNIEPMNTWHSVFTTWIFSACMLIGRCFANDNIGAFLYTLLQTLCLANALSSCIFFIKKQGANDKFLVFSILFFALCPLFPGYAQFISKDTLYVAFMLLFLIESINIFILANKNSKIKLNNYVKLALFALLTCLIRNNGIYVVLPSAVLFCIFANTGIIRLLGSITLGFVIGIVVLFNQVIVPYLGIEDATTSGIYSVCFQQSARVLRDESELVTDNEYNEINKILHAEKLGELYEPWISDPVKYTFKFFGTGKEIESKVISNYIPTWKNMFLRFPLSYAESFFAGNMSYYTFLPKIEGETYNNQAGNRLVFETYLMTGDSRHVKTEQIAQFDSLRTIIAIIARGFRHIPILSMLYCCAFYTWLLVACAISVIRQKNYRTLLAFLPSLFSLGVCMLSPVNDYFRYFLPIVVMTIPLISISNKGISKN